MKLTVELSEQVLRFIAQQAPEPRRLLRAGLRSLEREQGDIKALEGPLRDYFRLRVRGYRILFVYDAPTKQHRTIRCLFAERRNAVYQVFEEILRKKLLTGEE